MTTASSNSPSGYIDDSGNPVNQDGTPYGGNHPVNPASLATNQNTMTGLMNPSSYEQGFVNPYPDGTQQTTNNPQLGAQTNTNASGANDPITGLYQSLLGRAPDAAGLQYWQQQLASGKSLADITNAFKATPEYQQKTQSGGITPNPSTQPNTNPYGITTPNQFASSANPYIQAAQQTSLGNLAGAQTATSANRVNQQTPYGSLQYTQTGTDAQGNPIWSANQSLSPQLQQLTTQSLTGLQNSLTNPAYGINPGQTYSDAIMQRLQPQQAHAQEQQAASLANQGIMPGSDAYNNAMRTFNQGQNDQLTSAITGGMNVGLQANTAQNQTAANIKSLATPGYVNPYSQAATTGPDYTGAYATSSAADIAAKNAQLAQQANLQSGLFGLGSSALLGGGGLTGLANLGTSAYNSLFGTNTSNYFTNPTSAGTDFTSAVGQPSNLFTLG